MANDSSGSLIGAMIWMAVISLLLFWLPLFGPLIAGVVGGMKAGGVGKALLAVVLPALILAGLLFAFGASLTGFPIIGIIAAAGGTILIISGMGFLLVGAIIGGILG